MSDSGVGPGTLDRECLRFAAYLVDRTPDAYVVAKYREGHERTAIIGPETLDSLDWLLLRVASGHRSMAKLVDAYTAIFFKKATVRRKWMLLLAILETSAATYRHFDTPDSMGKAWLTLRLLGRGLGFASALVASMVAFGPLHLGVHVSRWFAGRR